MSPAGTVGDIVVAHARSLSATRDIIRPGGDRGAAAGRARPSDPRGPAAPSAPSTRRPVAPATTTAHAVRTAPGNTRGHAVPDALGRNLAQAEGVLRAGGLRGSALDRDPRGSNAVVVAQEPPAGVLVPPGSMVGLRTRTDLQPDGAPRRLRLGRGPTTATYRIVAPGPATHQLTVAVVAPLATDVKLWLENASGSRLPLLDSTRDPQGCRPSHATIHCKVRRGVPAEGVWTASISKRSAPPAAIEVTVTATPA